MTHLHRVLPIVLGLASVACAPALSNFEPAHVPEKGHFRVSGGLESSFAVGSLYKLIDAAETLSDVAQSRELSEEEKWQLYDSGVHIAMSPPFAAGIHVALAYAPLTRFEMSLRYAGNAPRLAARYQILEQEKQGVDFSVGLGAGRFTYEYPVSDYVPIIKLEDFGRWQFDVPIQFGKHGSWYRWWAAPKFLFTTFETSAVLELSGEREELARFDGTAVYVGGQLGAALGYKHVFFAAELTCVHIWGSAEGSIASGATRETDLGTFIVYPSIGLLAEF